MTHIPSPFKLPIVGNLLSFIPNPPDYLLQQAIQHGAVTHIKLLTVDAVVIADPELVQDVLVRQKADFVKSARSRRVLSGLLGNSLLISVGEYHTHQRKMIQPAFHSKRIHAYGEQMVNSTETMLDTWADGDVRDIHIDMMQLTMEIVSLTLFGNAVAEDALAVGRSIGILQENGSDVLTRFIQLPYWMRKNYYDRVMEAGETLERVVMNFIHSRREQGTPDTGDLLSMLLLSEDDNGERMTDQEVRDEAVTLFSAGHETTSNALTWTWYLLSQHPDVVAKLQHEVDTVLAGRRPTIEDLRNLPYAHQVIKEAMRLYPPAWMLMVRQTVRETQLGGYTIPKNWSVMVSPYVLHRHPDYWENPAQFNPDRFEADKQAQMHRYQYFPFGGGEHVCIGNSFAMMEAVLVLATIVSRYELEQVGDADVKGKAQITLAPRDGLTMRVKQRQTIPEFAPI